MLLVCVDDCVMLGVVDIEFVAEEDSVIDALEV